MAQFRVHTEDLNYYGFWVLTSGIDTTAFINNPICLYNHNSAWRGMQEEMLPIGIWKNLSINGTDMFAEPEFDMDDEFAAKIAKKVEKRHLRGTSISLQVLEWSEDPAYIKQGQRYPTVTKCVLREISICDIPANANAVMLTLYDDQGNLINLSSSADVEQNLPILKLKTNVMDPQLLALSLGLNDKATADEIKASLVALKAKADKVDVLEAKLKAVEDAQKLNQAAEAKTLLDAAIQDARLTAEQRQGWETLFASNHDAAKVALAAIPKPTSLSGFTQGDQGKNDGFKVDGMSFTELSRKDPAKLERLRENDFVSFNQLYKAEFGKDYRK